MLRHDINGSKRIQIVNVAGLSMLWSTPMRRPIPFVIDSLLALGTAPQPLPCQLTDYRLHDRETAVDEPEEGLEDRPEGDGA